MSKRSFRIALAVVIVSLLIVGVVVAYVVKQALAYPDTAHPGDGRDVPVEVKRGMNFPMIAELLADQGVIDRPRWFRVYAMHRGMTTKVRTGRYILRDNMTPKEVLDTLVEGVKDVTVRVTIPEGLHMLEVFALVEKAKVAKASELEVLARDKEFLGKYSIDGDTVDGYLFPDTYFFTVPTEPAKILDTMIKQHQTVWDSVRRRNSRGIDRLRRKLDWSDRDILTMASIVEKEAVVNEERPRIAQVFINRLIDPSFSPHKLDTDPTIRYGCMVPVDKSAACREWDPSKRLRTAQLRDRDNPYNTYEHEGLPPGPICNPGRASMEATVNPDGSNYFYFVSRNNGTHVFSKTRKEHERAVDKYQR